MHRDSTNENLQNIVYTVVENVLKDESLDYRLEENATNDPEDLSFVEEFSHFSIIDESRNHMKKYISHKDKQNMENPFILEDFRSGGKSKSSINTARKAKRRIPMEVNYLFPDLRSPEEEDLLTKEPLLNYEEYARNVLSNSDHINYDMFNLLKGKFYNILTTQNGSRILQKAITKTNKEILSWILFEIIEQVNELIVNPYANYFMQKFFIVLKTSDRLIFLSKLKVIELSKSKIGTYPMQSFIEQLSHKEEKQIILDAIRNDILNLCYDCYGVHVVDKVILCCAENLTEFIFLIILENFTDLANNINGLCAVKRIISNVKKDSLRDKILEKLVNRSYALIQHQYGNFAIKVALERWPLQYSMLIIQKLQNKFCFYSMHKYSSNVVEKCAQIGGSAVIKTFIEELAQGERVLDMLKNTYGSCVMQKILKMTVGTDKAKLIKIIMENLEKTGDKKLTLKWKSLVYAHITAEELIDAQKFSGMTQTQIPTAQVINPIPRNYITFNLFNNNDNVRIINSCSSCIQHRIGKNLINNNFLSPVIYARRQIPMNAIRSYSFGETCIQPMQNLYTGGGLNNFNIINKIRTQSSPVYQGGQNLYETRFMKFK